MEEQELQNYRNKLCQLQAELEAELQREYGEANPVRLEGVMGRVSRGDAMQVQQMALEMKRQREQRLLRARNALLRIERGEYGLCGKCQRLIGQARLDAMPDTLLCVHCAGPAPKTLSDELLD